MLGWTILFGLMSLCGLLLTLTGTPAGPVWMKTATYFFGLLFLLSLLTHVVRGRAR
jgi:hypothetical protein